MAAQWPALNTATRRRPDGRLFAPTLNGIAPGVRRYTRRISILDQNASLPSPSLAGNEPQKHVAAARVRMVALILFVTLLSITIFRSLQNNGNKEEHTLEQAFDFWNILGVDIARNNEHAPGITQKRKEPDEDALPMKEEAVLDALSHASQFPQKDSVDVLKGYASSVENANEKYVRQKIDSSLRGSFKSVRGNAIESKDDSRPGQDSLLEAGALPSNSEDSNNQQFPKSQRSENDRPETEKDAGIPSSATSHSSGDVTKDKFRPQKIQRNADAVPDSFESYVRSDMREGERAMCRINKACIMGNGMLSLPRWMMRKRRELQHCGLGPHVYHDGDESNFGGEAAREIDVDLVQLVPLTHFSNPAGTMTELLMDSILPAALLFDVFGTRNIPLPEGVVAKRCYSTPTTTDCEGTLTPESAPFKPSIFVPPSVAGQPDSWEAHALEMLGKAYGGGSVEKLSVADVVNQNEEANSANTTATCFRSILITEARVRDFPHGWFGVNSVLLPASGIDKAVQQSNTKSEPDGVCSIAIAILQKGDDRRLISADALQTKLSDLASEGSVKLNLDVQIIGGYKRIPFSDQIQRVRQLDILIGGTSHSLSNLMFMRSNTSVFEVFPFGWQPKLYEELASSMGIQHNKVFSAPQEREFKACLEHELVQLRKQNRISENEKPSWMTEIEGRWEKASEEFSLSSKTSLILNSDTSGISNFHTRSCARRQSLEFNVEKVARAVLQEAQRVCDEKAGNRLPASQQSSDHLEAV
jgi:hypothetical protein